MVRRSSVRRRIRDVTELVPAPLRLSACPLVWVDDDSLSLRERCDSYEAWFSAFMEWQSARWEWFEAHGWPGGWEAMQAETPIVPDAPFNPAGI